MGNGSRQISRADDEPFAKEECKPVELALPVLNNMHRNFFYQGRDTQGGDIKDSWGPFGLTRRETEVADLLCQGMSIKTVSSVLFISVSTVYQHLANIYKKTNVSSQHELVALLLKSRDI